MPLHKITCEQDIRDLQEKYGDSILFEEVESGALFCLSDLLFLYDGQELTIQHI